MADVKITVYDLVTSWRHNSPPPLEDPKRYNMGVNIPLSIIDDSTDLVVTGCVYWDEKLDVYVFEPVKVCDTSFVQHTVRLREKEYRYLKQALSECGIGYTLGISREPELQLIINETID